MSPIPSPMATMVIIWYRQQIAMNQLGYQMSHSLLTSHLDHEAHCDNFNTLQYTATHFSTLQNTATHCNSLQRIATDCNSDACGNRIRLLAEHTATHCDTLQHIANTLQYTATRCISLLHTATHCNTLQHTATLCNTLQHTATHCNTL